jgi:preprotein translocase subunit SecG
MAVVGVLLCIIILLQSDRAAGLGVIGGNSSNNDSYWSKNKGNSLEGTLARYTKIGGAIFIILGIVINYIH